MITKNYSVKELAKEKIFSAEGSNMICDYISNDLSKFQVDDTFEIIVNFQNVTVVSTAFIGRFQQRVDSLKSEFHIEKLRLVNIRKEIKSQFLKR